MSYSYGLTSSDLENAKKKLSKQKNYLENFTFLNSNGDKKSLLDYSFSPNLSKRYYPLILNKVHTFVAQAVDKDLTPVFLTATLDGFFRDFMRADYSRWTEKTRQKYLKHIPNDDRNGRYLDYIDKRKYRLTPRDLYKILSHQIRRFYRSKTLQDIRQKYNEDYMAIRVTEPHKKDGVPHIHILMYVPKRFIPRLYLEFHKFFPAPQNSKKINYREDGRKAQEVFDGHYETKGFQIEIRSPVAYILKYILKSFRNLVEGKELDYLQAWYVHNKIPRIITTHSLIAQDVYYHAALLDDDWYYLTDIKRYGSYKRDRVMNTFHLIDERKRELVFENGLYKIINGGKVVKEFGENKSFKMRFTEERPYYVIPKHQLYQDTVIGAINLVGWKLVPKTKYRYKIKENFHLIDMDIDGKKFLYETHSAKLFSHRDFKHIFSYNPGIPLPGHAPKNALTDLDLLEWFQNYDFDKDGVIKFGMIKKMLIERGLLPLEEIKIDDFNTNFDVKDFENV